MAQQAMIFDDFRPYSRDSQASVVERPRMYVHSNVYLPYGEVDPKTGVPVEGRSPRGRMQAKRVEYDQLERAIRKHEEEADKGYTLSLRSAVLLVAAVAFLLGMMLLSAQGTLTEAQKTLNRNQQQIKAYETANESLRQNIATASEETAICYAASQELGMIPPGSARAIHLPAADTRPTTADLPVYDLSALQGGMAVSGNAQ